ncbi:PITH domain-containing protein [Ceratobasidium sp. AG-Ba]|nr:PITH domain-containing protein [Ceratobasidium sp. AG-Ba]
MSHRHGQDCGHEHHEHGDDHDHDHDHSSSGPPPNNLYARIDRQNVAALNAEEGADPCTPLKAWHERLDETKWLESDADDQLILRIPFTGSVKLRALLLKTGPGEQTPEKVSLFPNADELDFSDASDREPAQSFDIAQSRDVGEYTVKPAKFSNCRSITLFFPAAQGADTLRIAPDVVSEIRALVYGYMAPRESLCDALLPIPLSPHTSRSATRRFMSLFTLCVFLFSILWVGVQAAAVRHTGAQSLDLTGEQAVVGLDEVANVKKPDFSQYVDLAVLPKHTLRSKGGRLIFVGDIHGMHQSLKHLLKKVHFDAAHDTLVHAGDVITKGPKSREVLQELISLDALGVRGNQDQKVVEWRGWIQWVLGHKGGKAWLIQMEKKVEAVKKPKKSDYERFRKEAASKGWEIPPRWQFGSDTYRLARRLKPNEYQYLLDMPIVLHIPSLHTIVVHAGILPMDPRRKILSKRQPLSHPPKAKQNKTEDALRNTQERALLSDIPQNTDPWVKLNMRTILDDGKISRNKGGSEWTDLWNKVLDLCEGFDVKPQSVPDDTSFEGSNWPKWMDNEFRGVKSLPCREVTVVYGHTAARGLNIKKWSKGLDTGCVHNLRLTALVLGKRWKPGFASNATSTDALDYLMEPDDELDGDMITFGRKGHD